MQTLGELFNAAEGATWTDDLVREQDATIEEAVRRWGQAVAFLVDL
jgi:hypothetical protein